MSIYNFRNAALSSNRVGFTAANVPTADQLRTTNLWLRGQLAPLRLLRLTDKERAQVGAASTPEEVHLNQLYAELARRFPAIMDLIGQPRDAIDTSVRMESSLGQLLGSLRQFRLGARAAAIVTLSEQTDMTDRIEGTIMQQVLPTPDNATPEGERSRLLTQFYPQQQARDAFFTREQGRRQRGDLRAQQHQELLDASTASSDTLLREEALRNLPLPSADSTATAPGPAKARAPKAAKPAPTGATPAKVAGKTKKTKKTKKSPKTPSTLH